MNSESGVYEGRHFTEWVDTVSQLKRDGQLEGALDLLEHLMEATEAEATANNWGVATWYYEQAAIVHSKRGDRAAEMAVLERFARQPKAPGVKPAKLAERLARLRH
jgi:hypothetical protein